MERLKIPQSLQCSFGSKYFIEHKINTHLYNALKRVKTKDLVSEFSVYLAVVIWLEGLLVLFKIKFSPYNWGRRIQRNNWVGNTDATSRADTGFPSCKDVACWTSTVHLQKLQVLKEALLIRFSTNVTYKNLACFHRGAVLGFVCFLRPVTHALAHAYLFYVTRV